MKPKYKPSADSKVELERAKRWYANLYHHDKESVDGLIANYIKYVNDRSNSQASKNMGIELIYKVLRRM